MFFLKYTNIEKPVFLCVMLLLSDSERGRMSASQQNDEPTFKIHSSVLLHFTTAPLKGQSFPQAHKFFLLFFFFKRFRLQIHIRNKFDKNSMCYV